MQTYLNGLMSALLITGLILGTHSLRAAAAEKTQRPATEQVYGYELMNQQERADYRARLHALKSEAEREQFRLEHRRTMQQRAKARGVTLPDDPPSRGRGKAGRTGGNTRP